MTGEEGVYELLFDNRTNGYKTKIFVGHSSVETVRHLYANMYSGDDYTEEVRRIGTYQK